MIDLWIDMPRWIKFLIAGLFLGWGLVAWLDGKFNPYAWGIGVVLLLGSFVGPSDSEKKGYKF